MRFGMNQSSLDPANLERAFQAAREAGADGIEITCEALRTLMALLGKNGPARVNRLKKQYQLEVPSIGLCALKQGESLFGPPKVASQAAQIISKAIITAGQIEAKVVLVPFFGKATIELEEELERVVEALRDLAEEAEAAGQTLGIESTLNVNQQLHMLASLGDYSSVKVYYDTGDTLARKLDPATSLRELGKERMCQMHFKDVRLGEEGNPPDWNVPLGEGDVDFPAVASALRAMGYDGWIVLETPATDDPAAAAKANLKSARELLG
jgi:L-ribulose-5-phosphate 3-epimerase